jgi:hypothetical protein
MESDELEGGVRGQGGVGWGVLGGQAGLGERKEWNPHGFLNTGRSPGALIGFGRGDQFEAPWGEEDGLGWVGRWRMGGEGITGGRWPQHRVTLKSSPGPLPPLHSPDSGSFIFGGSGTLGGGSGAASPAGTTLSAKDARRGLAPRPRRRKASLPAASLAASSSPWARVPWSLAKRPKSAEPLRIPGASTRPRKERGGPSPGLPARRPGDQPSRKGARPASFSRVARRRQDVPLGSVPSSPASSSSPGTSSKGFREDLRGRVPARGTLGSATPRLFRMGILTGGHLGKDKDHRWCQCPWWCW